MTVVNSDRYLISASAGSWRTGNRVAVYLRGRIDDGSAVRSRLLLVVHETKVGQLEVGLVGRSGEEAIFWLDITVEKTL